MSELQAKYFTQKIFPDQANEIFDEFMRLPRADQRKFCTRKAAELGVCRDTIERIVYDEKRINKRLANREKMRNIELIKAYDALGDAVDVQINFIRNSANLPPNMQGLAQNAATDLMNRLNFKEKVAEEDRSIHVVFSSDIALGMPKYAGEDTLPDGRSEATALPEGFSDDEEVF